MCTTVPGVGDGILKPALNVGSSPSLATSSLGSLHCFPICTQRWYWLPRKVIARMDRLCAVMV